MKIKQNNAHEFALFFTTLAATKDTLTIKDPHVVQRITTILRLKPGGSIILFNQTHHARFTCALFSRKEVSGTLGTLQKNKELTPHITVLLPLLKRDALEAAVYGLTECGANSIQLITTEKVHRKWQRQKELERLQRIIIAAAEQSKHFALPTLLAPINLQEAVEQLGGTQLLFADAKGGRLPLLKSGKVNLLVGPEGDLSLSEKEFITQKNALFFKLTPTILRAQQAAIIALSLLRI